MEFFHDIVRYGFLTNAVIACVLSGIVCGVLGTYIVCRRMVFLSGGITHASFGGIGIAHYLGQDPILGAALFSVLSAVGIEWSSGRGQVREDSAIGIVWSVGMALGIIFIYMTPGYAPNLMSFLFGSILTVTSSDIAATGSLAVIVVALFTLFHRPVMYVAFDRDFAASQGVPVMAVSYFMGILVALGIVFSIRTVGIVLLISLLTLPAVIANVFTKSFGRIALWAAVTAVAGNFLGVWTSYMLDIPAGASTIFILSVTLLILKGVHAANIRIVMNRGNAGE
ncbi:MAG: metal ABC transporter permease [Rikenellaceae bacterium]|nr:metal ABC transporter permease [Rikenellaceae bacterium]